MEKLFQSFQRLNETKNRNIEGTGLGLNITKQLVEMMDGSIRAESEYGKCSAFTVDAVQLVVDGTPIGSFTESLARFQQQRENYKLSLVTPKARLLIVDDNEMNLAVITELLLDTKVGVTTASSGNECVERLREAKYDLVLLDQMMPGIQYLFLPFGQHGQIKRLLQVADIRRRIHQLRNLLHVHPWDDALQRLVAVPVLQGGDEVEIYCSPSYYDLSMTICSALQKIENLSAIRTRQRRIPRRRTVSGAPDSSLKEVSGE